MKRKLSRSLGVTALIWTFVGPVAATPAEAVYLTCGQVITQSTTLDADLVCPSSDGLIVQGSGIVLSLNGHSVRGQLDTRRVIQPGATGDDGEIGTPYTVRFAEGQFAGIRIRGTGNAITGPGRIEQFAAGVVIEGGSRNVVAHLNVERNLGPPGTDDLGDGIAVVNSNANVIVGNTVRDNGPFDGIVVLGASGRNVLQGNVVGDNRQPEICPQFDLFRFSVSAGGMVHVCGPTHPVFKPFTFFSQQNQGIKLEGADTPNPHENFVEGNVVEGNGTNGVFLPSVCPNFGADQTCPSEPIRDNVIRGNQVNRNGFGYPTGLPRGRIFEGPGNGGGGIVMIIGGPNPPIRTLVVNNTVLDNARDGIAIVAHRLGNPITQSTIFGNTALRNNALPDGDPAFNGLDGNAVVNPSAPCDSNIWRGNNFGSSRADIGGPVPFNNLTNHPCVGSML